MDLLEWIPGKGDEAHIAYFKDHARLQFRGTVLPQTDGYGTVTFVGPGAVCSIM